MINCTGNIQQEFSEFRCIFLMVIYEFWKSVVLECQIYEKIFLVENISVAVYNIKSYLAFSKCLFPFPCPQKTLGIIILYGDDMDQMYFVLGSWQITDPGSSYSNSWSFTAECYKSQLLTGMGKLQSSKGINPDHKQLNFIPSKRNSKVMKILMSPCVSGI